jgi:uncharacterized protein (UPF0276 family)
MFSCDTNPDVERKAWRRPIPLGVGLPYLPGLDAALYRSGLIDYVEISADILCRPKPGEHGMVLDRRLVDAARESCAGLPIVVHGVELSIGSAARWNDAYVAMLLEFQRIWPFEWHSEHLHFQTVDLGDGRGETDIGVPLPLPLTQEAVETVARRARRLDELFGVPFLLENGAHYLGRLPSADGIADEADFLNRITRAGGCGLLLDLHNLYCNELNNGDEAAELIDRLDLDRVGEIHIAGGCWADGYRLDAHDSPTPGPVWDLLERLLPRCPGLAGVTFEIMPDHARRIGYSTILEELARLRTVWARHKARQGAEPCLA